MLPLMGIPKYALREMIVSRRPEPEREPIVFIEGRKPGLMGLLLTMLGLEPICRLTADERQILVVRTSLFGTVHQVLPMNRVASASFGVIRPLLALPAAMVCVVAVMILLFQEEARALAVVPLVLAAIFLVQYYIGKAAVVLIESTGGGVYALSFKGALVGGKRVDMEEAKHVVLVIRDLILASDAERDQSAQEAQTAAQSAAAPSSDGQSLVLNCPSCGHTQKIAAKWAGRKVKCPKCNSSVQLPML